MEALLKREVISDRATCRLLGVAASVLLTAFGAFVRIPLGFTPVPLTLQTFFVLFTAASLGRGLASVTQASYLILGIAGLPIFAGAGSGIAYLAGPTGGYLIGFVLAAALVGSLIRRLDGSPVSVFLLLAMADLLLFSCGMLWLRLLYGYSLPMLCALGLLPFLAGELIKLSAATALYGVLKGRLRQIF